MGEKRNDEDAAFIDDDPACTWGMGCKTLHTHQHTHTHERLVHLRMVASQTCVVCTHRSSALLPFISRVLNSQLIVNVTNA